MVDWDEIAQDLKKKGEVEIDLWGWPLLNSCVMVLDALKRRGFGSDDISLSVMNTLLDEKIKVVSLPKEKAKEKRRRRK